MIKDRFIFCKKSLNSKTGKIPITYSQSKYCPDSCYLKRIKVCYALYGNNRYHWNRLDKGTIGLSWEAFKTSIQKLPDGTLWRHNVAGDLIGQSNLINRGKLDELIDANLGKKGFTYTHYDPRYENNRLAIREANKKGFTVNASANGLHEIWTNRKYKIPMVTILPHDESRKFFVARGLKFVICPTSYKKGIQCINCNLCQNPKRKNVICFPSHGVAKKRIKV